MGAVGNERLDECNAVHEAGHAVVALLLNVPVHFVHLNLPDPDRGAGRCYRMKADPESAILIGFAGVGAELISPWDEAVGLLV